AGGRTDPARLFARGGRARPGLEAGDLLLQLVDRTSQRAQRQLTGVGVFRGCCQGLGVQLLEVTQFLPGSFQLAFALKGHGNTSIMPLGTPRRSVPKSVFT